MAKPIEFDDREGLTVWLQDQPYQSCAAIGTRVAMRVLPLVLHAKAGENRFAKTTMLYAWRAAFVGWAATLYTGEKSRELVTQAAFAFTAAGSLASPDPAFRAVQAAAGTVASDPSFVKKIATVAHIEPGAAVLAAAAASHATAAARATYVSEAANMVWESVTEDVRFLSESKDGQLIQRPLWLTDVRDDPEFHANFPRWVRAPFDAFGNSPLVTHGPWGVWLAWYRATLPNTMNAKPQSRFGHAIDLEIAANQPEFWERDPDRVMADIAEIASWPWREKEASSPVPSKAPRKKPASSATSGKKRTSRASSPASDEPTAPPAVLPPELVPEQPKAQVESVEPQSDEPTSDDQLGRRPFAQALVERMDKIYQKGGHDGFAAHIYAPWGAGKTSVLMMMSEVMSATGRKSADGNLAPRWVVVHFNAWQQERRNPPWWPLMERLKTECLRCLSDSEVGWRRMFKTQAALLRAHWIWWKIRTDALAYIVALLLAALCIWMLWNSSGTNLELIMKLFTAAVLAFASFLAAGRVAFFGSASAAKLYEDISQDPLKRITGFFNKVVTKTGMPVCIFIDDLDRCHADYVVDLLEGIQTSFRHSNVAYVVAADRNWIKSSFESRYSMFSGAVGNLGQPLGYLFLEKVFQVSTPVPGMGDKTRSAYWNRLLKKISSNQQTEGVIDRTEPPSSSAETEQFDSSVAAKRADLREKHGENLTREQAESILEKTDSAEDLAAVVLELNTSRAAEKEAEHLLAQFTDVVPDNPRVMKRMINAFAMRQTIGILEGNAVPTEVLARWTILEQRYPALADILIAHPEWTQALTDKVGGRKKLPPLLMPFTESEIVRSIIGKVDGQRLTVDHVRKITRGSVT